MTDKAERRKFLKAALTAMAGTGTIATTSCISAMCYVPAPPVVQPEYTILSKGKKQVVVVCRSMDTNLSDIPRDIARRVGDVIHVNTKNKKLEVVKADVVNAWLDNCNDVFDDFLDVGRDKMIAADYVIGIELIGYQLCDPHTPHLLQGKAKLQVYAFDCKSGETVANRTVDVIFPSNVPMTTGPGVDQAFRSQFVQIVSERIANLFVPHHSR